MAVAIVARVARRSERADQWLDDWGQVADGAADCAKVGSAARINGLKRRDN
ncbi:MAG: hypothetical protein JWO24_1522 [Rhodospirillales bacterium]|jgi:hypothetical protein|nr:hypothetical protein [Rhodospirillales bacterium]